MTLKDAIAGLLIGRTMRNFRGNPFVVARVEIDTMDDFSIDCYSAGFVGVEGPSIVNEIGRIIIRLDSELPAIEPCGDRAKFVALSQLVLYPEGGDRHWIFENGWVCGSERKGSVSITPGTLGGVVLTRADVVLLAAWLSDAIDQWPEIDRRFEENRTRSQPRDLPDHGREL